MKIRDNGQYRIIGLVEVVNRKLVKVIVDNENEDKLYLQIPKNKSDFLCIFKYKSDSWKYNEKMPIFIEELKQLIGVSIITKKVKKIKKVG